MPASSASPLAPIARALPEAWLCATPYMPIRTGFVGSATSARCALPALAMGPSFLTARRGLYHAPLWRMICLHWPGGPRGPESFRVSGRGSRIHMTTALARHWTHSTHSRRHLLGGTLTALAAPALLAACGAQSAAQPGLSQEAKPTTLEWFGKLKGVAQNDIDAFVQQYKTARPNVTLNVTSVSNTAEGKAKLTSYAAAGTPVDVVSTFVSIPTLRTLNGGYSLNDYVKRDKFDTSQFAQNTMRGVEVKGKILALPHAYAGNELVFVANKSLFQKYGVPLPAADWKNPWGWQQFREAMKKLTNFTTNPPVAGTSRFGTIYNVPPMWGARWTSEDGRTILADKPEMLQAWTEYYDMVV